jgi:hypothetical protein
MKVPTRTATPPNVTDTGTRTLLLANETRDPTEWQALAPHWNTPNMAPAYQEVLTKIGRLGMKNTRHKPITPPTFWKLPPAPKERIQQPPSSTPPNYALGAFYTTRGLIQLFTAEEERDFASDELFGEDKRQAAIPQAALRELPNYTNPQEGEDPTSNYTNPQEGTKPAWLQCDFRHSQNERAKTSHKPAKPNKVVCIKNKTTTTRQKRKQWIASQSNREEQQGQHTPIGWNHQLPKRHHEKGNGHPKHGESTAWKQPKYSHDASQSTQDQLTAQANASAVENQMAKYTEQVQGNYHGQKRKTFTATSATAKDKAKGQQMKEQGFKPVVLAKTPYRPKGKSVYLEPDYTPQKTTKTRLPYTKEP